MNISAKKLHREHNVPMKLEQWVAFWQIWGFREGADYRFESVRDDYFVQEYMAYEIVRRTEDSNFMIPTVRLPGWLSFIIIATFASQVLSGILMLISIL